MPPAATEMAVLIPETRTGLDEPTRLPLPSWPEPLAPQHATLPLVETAQACAKPAEIAVAVSPETVTGSDDDAVVPLPSWPEPLRPQQRTVASASNAQLASPPAATAVASTRPATVTGTGESTPFPSPS